MKVYRLPALALALSLLAAAGYAANLYRSATAESMTGAANAFLATLSDEQQQIVIHEFDDPERTAWHFIPKPFEGEAARAGLTLKSMNEKNRAAAKKLLTTGLSQSGYKLTNEVMELEGILSKIEGPVEGRPWSRDPQMYYFSVFGKPGKGRWGWRCEGHHLSLNFEIEGDKLISATPAFYGANPATVPAGPHKGLRTLAARADLARELYKSLSAEQAKSVLQAKEAPDDLRSAGDAQPSTTKAVGLDAGSMSESQQKILRMLLEEYANTMSQDIAMAWLGDVDSAGFENVKFAWWGSSEPGDRHYYRVQGPTFIIEFCNTQNDANHIHSFWRDLRGDFGVSLAKK